MSDASLKSAGLRTTAPRLQVLEIFENSSERHLGAEDIYHILREQGHTIGLATVYRVLTQFESAGIVLRHRFAGEGKASYELNDEVHHDHMVCMKCGRVFEFVDDQIELRQTQVADSLGFELDAHSLNLYGVCKGMCASGVCSIAPDEGDSIHRLDSSYDA